MSAEDQTQFCIKCGREYPLEYKVCPVHGVQLRIEPGDVVREKYKILRVIGTGAMGQVFEVEDLDFNLGRNRSAMKVPLGAYAADAAFVQRFRSEAAKQRKVDHPNVVRIEHIDKTDSGTPFLLMELVEGQSLRWWMSREPRLKWQNCVAIAHEVALALKAALGANLVHCDIKPENILSTSKLGPLPLKVMDFGLAKETSVLTAAAGAASRGTVWGGETVAGTPEYMSPEQTLRRANVGPASDIYSLGVVLFEMLACKLPYAAIDSVESARTAHAAGKPATLNDCPGIPAGLVDLVASMLSLKQEDRPTVDEVIARLEELAGTPVSSAAPTVSEPGPPPFDTASKRRESVVPDIPAARSVPSPETSQARTRATTLTGSASDVREAPALSWPPAESVIGKETPAQAETPVRGKQARSKVVLMLVGVGVLGAAALTFGVISKAPAQHFSSEPSGGGSGISSVPDPAPPDFHSPQATTPRPQDLITPTPETPKPKLSTLMVTCDVDCVLRVDKKSVGTLSAGHATTLKLALAGSGSFVLDAGTPDDRDHELLKITAGNQTADFKLLGIRDARLKKIAGLVAQGNTSLHANQYPDAIAHFDEALRLDPENKDAKTGKEQALRECNVFGNCQSKP